VKRLLSILVGCNILIYCNLSAQELQYTQYFVHRQWTNPAAMGTAINTTAAFAGQYRLYGFDNAPMTGALQITVPFGGGDDGGSGARSIGSYYSDGQYSKSGSYYSEDEGGAQPMAWGIALQAGRVGVQQRYKALGAYSYQLMLGSSNLSFGLALGAEANNNTLSSLNDEYNVDPLQYSGQKTTWDFIAQAGIYWYNSIFYASLYSPSATAGDVFLQGGCNIALGSGDADDYGSSAKKNNWELHLQAGRIGTGEYRIQAATVFTLKNMLGIGIAWERPMNMAALVTLSIGNIQLGYSYSMLGLNEYILQHEITVRIRFAGKKEEL